MCQKQRQGFTLIELTVVMAILTVAVLFFTQVMLASRRLDPVAEESRLAAEAARIRLEEMRALPFEQIFGAYRSGQPNARFDVAGLSPAPGQDSVGRIELPELAGALREDIENKAWGLPRDLNRDGEVDASDHALDALILPVTVRLEWASKSGKDGRRSLVLHSMLARL